jgi:anti-sigma factor RsiW
MDCKQTRELLTAHADGELGVTETIAIEHHLTFCVECNGLFAEQVRVSRAMKKHTAYFAAPANLAERIKATLPVAQPSTLPGKHRSVNWGWWKVGIGAVFATLVASNIMLYHALPSYEEQIGDEVIASHVRSLISNRTTDVLSTDQHTVKPWFNGKIDFSPPVADLSTQGFSLTGGRLDYIHGRSVAALVYARRKHAIDLYIWPTVAEQEATVQSNAYHGYHILHWQ